MAQWLVLSLSQRKVVGSNPPMVVRTPYRSARLAPGYLANARTYILTIYHLPLTMCGINAHTVFQLSTGSAMRRWEFLLKLVYHLTDFAKRLDHKAGQEGP